MRYLKIALTSTLLLGCDGAVQLCGQYACVYYQNSCRDNDNCSEVRSCESASSIRDRTPQIINELREIQRACSALPNTQAVTTVRWDDNLATASAIHSRDMAQIGTESFVGSDGSSTQIRIETAGATPERFAENIKAGPQTSAETINLWLDNETDCENMLDSNFTRIGMACSTSELKDSGPYWSLIVAGPDK